MIHFAICSSQWIHGIKDSVGHRSCTQPDVHCIKIVFRVVLQSCDGQHRTKRRWPLIEIPYSMKHVKLEEGECTPYFSESHMPTCSVHANKNKETSNFYYVYSGSCHIL